MTLRIQHRRTLPRAVTLSVGDLRRDVVLGEPSDPKPTRPETREDCRGAVRPCPWVACRHHLYLDVNEDTGSIKINFPDLEPWELKHTCAIDVAERGGITLEEVGEFLNVTRERIRQMETIALLTLRRMGRRLGHLR